MAINRWEPFREMVSLKDAVDRLFQDSFLHPDSGFLAGGANQLPLDVSEGEDKYEVRASIPGMNPDDLEITIQGDTLTIHGEYKSEDREGHRWVMRESRTGSFERRITFPTSVKVDQSEAHCENGMLVLTLPKADEARPRRITVGGQAQLSGGRKDSMVINQPSDRGKAQAGSSGHGSGGAIGSGGSSSTGDQPRT